MLRASDPAEVGGYRLLDVLGEGGQGVVYLGSSAAGERVAVKIAQDRLSGDPDARRLFLREGEAARRVAPFCTARVLSVGVFHDRPYIVSEYVQGPSLQQLVRTDGPRGAGGLQRLAVATLTALDAVHRAGVVHRDFKPANVIMGPEGPVVIDFGIAKALDGATTRSGLIGTPSFMAPELFDGAAAGPASDVFAWAVTMVFAATGANPFQGDTLPAVMRAVLNDEPDLSGVPAEVRGLLGACLAKDPAARPSVAAMLHDLTRRPGTPIPSAPVPAPVTPVPAPLKPSAPPATLVERPPATLVDGPPQATVAEAAVPTVSRAKPTVRRAPPGAPTVRVNQPKTRVLHREPLQTTQPPPPRPSKRGPWIVVAVFVAALLAMATYALFNDSSKLERPREIVNGSQVNAIATGVLDNRPVVATGDDGGAVRVWDLSTRQATGIPFTGHRSPVLAVATGVVKGQALLVSGDKSGAVHLSRLGEVVRGRTLVTSLGGDVHDVGLMAVKGKAVVVASSTFGEIQYATLDGDIKRVTAGGKAAGKELAVCQAGGQPVVVSGDYSGVIRQFDAAGKLVRTMATGFGHMTSELVCAEVGGRPVVVGASYDGTVRTWDLRTGQETYSFRPKDKVQFTAVAVVRLGGRTVALARGERAEPYAIDLEARKEIDLDLRASSLGTTFATARLDDHPVLVSGGYRPTVFVDDVEAAE